MKFVRIHDVLLHYRLAGPEGAPALVLVNSLGTDARIWDGLIADLARDYRILSYDKRGHGLSDAPAGEYSLEHHVDDLTGLLDHVGVERLALCGVSVGGLIGQGFALRAPERLTALVLSNTAPKMGEEAMWNSRADIVRKAGLAAIADMVMERWFSLGFHQSRPDELALWRNLFLRTDPHGYAATCATLRDANLSERVGAIDTPTLVIAGAEDGAIPVEQVRAGAARIPGARFEILPGTGHIPSIERPDQVAALMRQFFKEASYG